jgi:UDP-N-acetylmuramoyl-tripeptide--D-alanyl-D-alanine ligase
MRPRSLEQVAGAVRGRIGLPGPAVTVTGVAIDSRSLRPGDLFVALSGERNDGHRFVPAALAAGAAGAIVEQGRDLPVDRARLVEVPDTGRALLALAGDERASMTALVVGITGSTGKTCTKDFIASVLGQGMRVVASPASFNNEVGLPLTILSATAQTQAVVCEMGARGPGHIRLLCEVARPRIGVVTNIGVAHLELFGSPEILRDSKAELPESLPEDGVAVLNGDDAVARTFATRTRARSILYGTQEQAEVRARGVSADPRTGKASFDLVTSVGEGRVELPVPGTHMVWDALAAAGVGVAAGVGLTEILRGLAKASISAGRMDTYEAAGGWRIVDDAYNANPASMAAALKTVRSMSGPGRVIAVLGHMAELGRIAPEEHERVGELVARLGIDELVTVGPEARLIAVGAEREGVEPERIHRCKDAGEALAVVRSMVRPGDLVLVKASRVASLDALAASLRGDAEGSPPPVANGAAA